MTVARDPTGLTAAAVPASTRRAWTLERGYLLILLPPLAFLAVFFLWPLAGVVLRSVSEPEPGFGQYALIFSRPAYIRVLAYTFEVALTVSLLCLVIAYPVAAVVARAQGRVLQLCFALIIIPFWISTVVRSYAWLIIFQRRGVLNEALIGAGLIETPLRLMNNHTGVVIGMVHVLLPFMILPLLATLRGIDPSYMRAAAILGANPIRAFLRVYLPMSLPGVTAGVALVFITSLGFYITPALLGGDRNMMIAILIEQQVSLTGNWPLASALSSLLLVLTVLLYLVYDHFARRVGRGVLG